MCYRQMITSRNWSRARKNLIVTWNTGKGKYPAQPSLPLVALQTYWEERTHGTDR